MLPFARLKPPSAMMPGFFFSILLQAAWFPTDLPALFHYKSREGGCIRHWAGTLLAQLLLCLVVFWIPIRFENAQRILKLLFPRAIHTISTHPLLRTSQRTLDLIFWNTLYNSRQHQEFLSRLSDVHFLPNVHASGLGHPNGLSILAFLCHSRSL